MGSIWGQTLGDFELIRVDDGPMADMIQIICILKKLFSVNSQLSMNDYDNWGAEKSMRKLMYEFFRPENVKCRHMAM